MTLGIQCCADQYGVSPPFFSAPFPLPPPFLLALSSLTKVLFWGKEQGTVGREEAPGTEQEAAKEGSSRFCAMVSAAQAASASHGQSPP